MQSYTDLRFPLHYYILQLKSGKGEGESELRRGWNFKAMTGQDSTLILQEQAY